MNHLFRILKHTRELWRFYAAVSAFSVLLALLNLSYPLLSGRAIDEIRLGTGANVGLVVLLVFLIFAQDVASTIASNIGGYIGDIMGARLYKILGSSYYRHLMNLPQQYFDTELSGKIINRLNRSINQIVMFMVMMSNNFLQFIFTTIFCLAFVFFYSWQVGLLLLSLYPIYVWMTLRTSDKWMKFQGEKNENLDIAAGRFAESVAQVKVVKSFGQHLRELRFFDRHVDRSIEITHPQSKYWHNQDVLRRAVLNVIFLGVYLSIFLQAAHGQLTPGEAVALILFSMQIRIPIFTISWMVENTQKAIADSRDYFDIMGLEPAIQDIDGAKELLVKKAQIVFEKVAFHYDEKSKAVLQDINFEIKPDSKIALVGESGEGKTTLTNLLMRLYEPQEGRITIDGQDITRVTQQSLRANIAVVFQDPSLFSGTIRENISYANPKASTEQVEAAAQAANAHEFVDKLEKGYDTEIGERGLKLSGGQKQRIAIARALLKDAPILVLDEATSSLDSRSEALVQEALERLMKGRTTIIIAHRLSTIQKVDQIITLRGGTVDEIGAPSKLAKTDGIYGQLLRLQQQGPDTEKVKKSLRKFEMAA